MSGIHGKDEEFINKLTQVALENLENENFRGKELACAAEINYHTLNRRLHNACNKTPNQFIREIRLEKAIEFLLSEKSTISEIAYRVGFSSPTYFNKCFHEFHGFTPGESRVKIHQKYLVNKDNNKSNHWHKLRINPFAIIGFLSFIFMILAFIFLNKRNKTPPLSTDNISQTSSIAVLPINNFTGDPGLEYFSSGVHDAIIGELGRLDNLVVKSRTSTLQYQNGKHSVQQIANELEVNYIVEGSVLGSEDSLQIIVQLIKAFPEEKHVWSGTYFYDWQDVLSIYRNVTRHIAENIHLKLDLKQAEQMSRSREINPALYQLYMRGMFQLNRMTPDGLAKGLEYLSEAISIDPDDPLPYLGLSIAYSNTGHVSEAGEEAHLLAKTYALKALELDSTLAEAYAVLSTFFLYHEWNWEKTDYNLSKAIEINPNLSLVRYTNSWYSLIKGENEKAINEMKLAVEIDPLNPICTGYLGWLYLWLDLFPEAILEAQRTLEIDPNYTMAYYIMGSALAEQGKYEEAIEIHKKGIDIEPGFLCGLGVTYARAGKTEQAFEIAGMLEKNINAWNAWGISDIYATLGETELAMKWVETAFDLRQDFIPWMEKNPYYKPLYNEPRFKELAQQLDLTQ